MRLQHLQQRALRHRALALSVLVMLPTYAGVTLAQVSSTGDASANFTPGDSIGPAPIVDLTGRRVFVGFTGTPTQTGTLSVVNGGLLTAAQVGAGVGGQGNGSILVSNGGRINLTGGAAFNGLDVGSWGTGAMTVSNGGWVVCTSNALCPSNSLGTGAGSTGRLTIDGGLVLGLGHLNVGNGAVVPAAPPAPAFGTPGASTTGILRVVNNGHLLGVSASVGSGNLSNPSGAVTGSVTVDGQGSIWNLIRNGSTGNGQVSASSGQAFLSLAAVAGGRGEVTVSNGGTLGIYGGRADPATDSSLPGLTMSGLSNSAGGDSVLNVTTGGTVRINGDTGTVNVGRNSGTAVVNVTSGGSIAGSSPSGLLYFGVGRLGATGTVNVSGAGSTVTIAGVGGVNTQTLDNVAGRLDVGVDGRGTVNVTNGGAVLVSDNGMTGAITAPSLRVGRTASGVGAVTVNGASSSLTVQATAAGNGQADIVVGQGGVGTMTVGNSGQVALLGSGQRNFVVGDQAGSSGTLNLSSGGRIEASRLGVGNAGGTGVVNVNNATVNLNGVVNVTLADGTLQGGGMTIARGNGGSGTVNLQNGAIVDINTSASRAFVVLGGGSALGQGSGTLSMSSGSQINFTGAGANPIVSVGNTTGGVGTMTMTGGSAVNLTSTGQFVVGAAAGSVGMLSVTGGSIINAGAIFGVAHNGTTGTGGTATVTLNNSTIVATNAYVGAGGYLGGNGTLVGNLVMAGGTVSPGFSPGRLVIDGGFSFLGGRLVLEVQEDGAGGYLTDQIVFRNGADVDFANTQIEFKFLGDTDPSDFLQSGQWALDTFFRLNPAEGAPTAFDGGISSLLSVGGLLADLFAGASFDASADAFNITRFAFDADSGVTDLAETAVPLPGSLALLGLGILGLIVRSTRARRLEASRNVATPAL